MAGKLVQIICGIVILAGWSLEALAEPEISAKTVYYEIKGETARELRRAMNEKRPKAPDGSRHDGLTNWRITWKYAWQKVDGRFAIRNPKVTVTLITGLPKWEAPPQSDQALVERWQTYLRALVKHEDHHASLAVKAARDLEMTLLAIPLQNSEVELKRLADEAGRNAIDENNKRDAAYDSATAHGLKEGAKFP